MIAVDTSSLVAFFKGETGRDVESLTHALETHAALFPPVVLSELLSDYSLSAEVRDLLIQIPLVPVRPGYWERAGLLRAAILKRGTKARLADSLIAQSCMDQNVPLLTRDADFKRFLRFGLQLLPY